MSVNTIITILSVLCSVLLGAFTTIAILYHSLAMKCRKCAKVLSLLGDKMRLASCPSDERYNQCVEADDALFTDCIDCWFDWARQEVEG